MKTLLRFARLNKSNRVVLVELWGEEDGTPRNLRKTTLNPTDNVEKFRQDFPSDDMESLMKAIQEEILALEEYVRTKSILSGLIELQTREEEQSTGRLAEIVERLNSQKS